MNNETWTRVDQYLAGQLLPPDEVLEAALRASDAAGLPSINVTPTQGALLQMFARLCGARRILEIGTLGGYSTIWLARALPHDGRLITLEADEQHAAIARANIGRAGLGRCRRDQNRARTRVAAGAGARVARPVRSDVHRCGQGQHTRVLRCRRSTCHAPAA